MYLTTNAEESESILNGVSTTTQSCLCEHNDVHVDDKSVDHVPDFGRKSKQR